MAKRKAVGFLTSKMALSERRSCRIVGLRRSVQQYRPIDGDDGAVVARLKELASENRRYGYLRLHALLRREGLALNRKRTYRLYRAEGLQVRTKKRRKLPRRDRVAPQVLKNRCSAGLSIGTQKGPRIGFQKGPPLEHSGQPPATCGAEGGARRRRLTTLCS